MNRKGLVGVAKVSAFLVVAIMALFLFTVYLLPVFAGNFAQQTSDTVVESGATAEVINVTVINQNLTHGNITNVTIELPLSNLTYRTGTNNTNISGAGIYFTNTSARNLSWWNTSTNGILNASTAAWFLFQVAAASGEQNVTIIVYTIHQDGAGTVFTNSSTIQIQINDSTAPVLNETVPSPSGYIGGSLSSVRFQTKVFEANLNKSANVTVFFRRQGAGAFSNKNLSSCEGDVQPTNFNITKSYICNTTVDLSGSVSDGDVIQFFFNMTDLSSNPGTGNNGSEDSLLSATVDTTTPSSIAFVSPTPPASSFITDTTPDINVSFNETNFVNCTMQWFNTSGAPAGQNFTNSTNNGGSCLFNAFGTQSDGQVNVTVFVFDGPNNVNSTPNRNFTIDATRPSQIDYLSPTPVASIFISDTTPDINVTATETNFNNCTFQIFNSSGAPAGQNFTNATNINGTPVAGCFLNAYGTQSDGQKNVTVFVFDTASNVNSTLNRNFTIDSTRASAIDFVSPTPAANSFTSSSNVTINVSFTETNPNNCTLTIFNTSGSPAGQNFTNTTIIGGNSCLFFGFGTQPDGQINFTVFVNDQVALSNSTANRNITVDTTVPSAVGFVAPTLANRTYFTNAQNVSINITFNETNPNRCVVEFGNASILNLSVAPVAVTGQSFQNYCFLNLSSHTNGNINFTVFVNDTAGNSNVTLRRVVHFDNTTPVLNETTPTPSGFVRDTTSVLFQIKTAEQNLNSTYNVTVSYRRQGGPADYKNKTLNCNSPPGTPPSYVCNVTINLALSTGDGISLGDGGVVQFFFNTTDEAGNTQTNGTAASPNSATADESRPSAVDYLSPTPSANSFTSTSTPVINITFTETNFNNCTFQIFNTSGSPAGQNFTNTTNIGGCMLNAYGTQSDGQMNVTVFVFDKIANANSTANRNFTIDGSRPSAVDFVSPTPAANSFTSSSNVTINVSFTETNPNNCTLTIFNTSGSPAGQNFTNTTIIGGNSCLFFGFGTQPDGQINFTVFVNDQVANSNATANRNITVDTTRAASVDFVGPTITSNGFINLATPVINITFTETNFNNCTLSVFNITGAPAGQNFTNTTIIGGNSCLFNGYGSQSDGQMNVTVFVNDQGALANSTANRNFTVDTTRPSRIDYQTPTPTANTFVSSTTPVINITATETNFNNCTFQIFNTSGAPAGQNFTNSTNLNGTPVPVCMLNAYGTQPDGQMNVTVFVFDNGGNANATVNQNFTIDSLRASAVVFVSPTPAANAFTRSSTPIINVTFNETNFNNCTLQIFNTSGAPQGQNFTNATNINASPFGGCLFNAFGTQSDGPVNFTVFVNDQVALSNSTLNLNFSIDTSRPSLVDFLTPTPPANTFTSSTTPVINVTFNETSFNNCTFQIFNTSGAPAGQNFTNATNINGSTIGGCQLNAYGTQSDGAMNVTVFVFDTASNANATANRNFTIDSTRASAVAFVSPTAAANSNITDTTPDINVSFTETNFNNCTLQWFNTSGAPAGQNFTNATNINASPFGGCLFPGNALGTQSDGPVNFTVFVNDQVALSNSTPNRAARIDSTRPSAIDYLSPTPAAGSISSTTPVVNITFTETNFNNCTFQIFNTSGAPAGQNFTNATNNGGCMLNSYGSQSDGTMNVTVFVFDGAANANSTANRAFTVDTSAPSAIDFVAPSPVANGNISSSTPIINITFTEGNFNNCTLTVFNTSGSPAGQNFTNSTNNGGSCLFNAYGSQSNGAVNVTVFVNDQAAKSNSTANRRFTVDTAVPGLVAWNYSFVEKVLTLRFNETIDIVSLTLGSMNITPNGSTPNARLNGLNESGNTLRFTTTNHTIVQINFSNVQNNEMNTLIRGCNAPSKSDAQLDIAAGAVKDLAQNNVVAVADLGYQSVTTWSLEVPDCDSLFGDTSGSSDWHVIDIAANAISNTSSLSSNTAMANVFASMANNYTNIYYKNSSTGNFQSFILGSSTNTLTNVSTADSGPYEIKMNSTDRIEAA